MAIEIERKFLVDLTKVDSLVQGQVICQGYLPTEGKTAVRIRLSGEQAFLTIKGVTRGATRTEFEYAIPVADAKSMLVELCLGPKIEKTRYLKVIGRHTWEIDVFSGENQGLVVAEVELNAESESIEIPNWVTEEVTDDPRYYNVNLLSLPFSQW